MRKKISPTKSETTEQCHMIDVLTHIQFRAMHNQDVAASPVLVML